MLVTLVLNKRICYAYCILSTELSETCQLVLDGVQEDGFHVSDYLFLECPIEGVVPSEQRLVLT